MGSLKSGKLPRGGIKGLENAQPDNINIIMMKIESLTKYFNDNPKLWFIITPLMNNLSYHYISKIILAFCLFLKMLKMVFSV
jgi:hypothetical protein